jgi:hypothetical protein
MVPASCWLVARSKLEPFRRRERRGSLLAKS